MNTIIADARKAGRTALDEAAGKALLAQFGVKVPKTVVVASADDAAAALTGLAFPIVVKVVSPEILHKSDAGGVRVNVASPREVSEAIRAMSTLPAISTARVEGWLVEEMAPGGQEMVVGGF